MYTTPPSCISISPASLLKEHTKKKDKEKKKRSWVLPAGRYKYFNWLELKRCSGVISQFVADTDEME